MSSTVDDVRLLLLKGDERRGYGVGLHEVHAAAYRLQDATDGYVFGDASFGCNGSGVRSPEVADALTWFDYAEQWRDGSRVDHSDHYYRLTLPDDIEAAEDRWAELDGEDEEAVERVLDALDDDPDGFIEKAVEDLQDAD